MLLASCWQLTAGFLVPPRAFVNSSSQRPLQRQSQPASVTQLQAYSTPPTGSPLILLETWKRRGRCDGREGVEDAEGEVQRARGPLATRRSSTQIT